MTDGKQLDNPATVATPATLGQRWRHTASLARAPAAATGVVLAVGLLVFGAHDDTWALCAVALAAASTARIVDDRLSGADRRELWMYIATTFAVTAPPYAAVYLLPAQLRHGLTGGIIVTAAEVLAIMIYAAIPVRPPIPPTAASPAPPATPKH